MRSKWSDFEPHIFMPNSTPRLFHDLWEVAAEFGRPIFKDWIRVFAASEESRKDSEPWDTFVAKMEKRTRRRF